MRTNRLLLPCMFVVLPAVLNAQQPVQRTLLEQAESRLGAGVFHEARDLLEQWRRENPNAARTNQEQQARYHLLSARLLTHADSAEDQYLTIAVNYPTSRSAPEALLRLAQARHARGDSQQASTYLQRLLTDYPNSDQRAMGAVWLARIQPRTTQMCSTLRGVQPGSDPEVIENLKSEIARVCDGAAPAAAKVAAQNPKVEPPRPDTVARTPAPTPPPASVTNTPANPPPMTSGSGRVAIQVGAFRELSGARGVYNELQRAGFTDVRLVRVPGNNLIRVRIGRFENRAAASATLARLAARDISAVLVTDADAETRVQQ